MVCPFPIHLVSETCKTMWPALNRVILFQAASKALYNCIHFYSHVYTSMLLKPCTLLHFYASKALYTLP